MINNVSNYLVLLVPFLLFNSIINAQSSFVNAGGDITNSSGSISYSIGQLFTNELINESGGLCEGVQQVNNNSLAAIKEIESPDFSFFPNPTNGEITLKNSSFSTENNYYISVTDMVGKKLQSLKLNQNETTINLSELGANGICLISVHSQEGYFITSKRVLLTD